MKRFKSVRLPGKQVLDEMADKQKTVPEEANLASFGTVFLCSKMRKYRGFRGYFEDNSGSPVIYEGHTVRKKKRPPATRSGRREKWVKWRSPVFA